MSIGSELSSARSAAGFSLDVVASKTKLRSSLIAAIEKDDFSLCGGDVYARGHIRVLANLYRIDSVHLLEQFDATYGPTETALDDLAQTTSQNLERRNPLSWKTLSAAAGTLLVAVVIGSQFTSGTNIVAGPTATSSEQSPAATPDNSPTLPAVATADAGVKVRLTVVKSYSWISVTAADGSSIFTGQIEKGEVREFTDPQVLRLVIGNAGAVSVSVNGVDRGIAGDIGQVVRLEFTPDAENSQG